MIVKILLRGFYDFSSRISLKGRKFSVTITVLLIFIFTSNVFAQSDEWVFLGLKYAKNIPSSCAKEVEYGIVFIKKNENYQKNKKLVIDEVKSKINEFLYTKYFSFTESEGGVAVITELRCVCNRGSKNEMMYTSYHIMGAQNRKSSQNSFEQFLKNTTGIKSHSVLKVIDLASAVVDKDEEIIVYKSLAI